MTAEHTPGPWSKSMLGGGKGGPNAYRVAKDPDHGTSEEAVARVHGRHDGAASANARLIAAAPELLEALEEAAEHMSANVPGDGWGLRDKGADADRKETLVRMRAAIAKATGVEP